MGVWGVLIVRGLLGLRSLALTVLGAVVACVLLLGLHVVSVLLGIAVGAMCYGWAWVFSEALGTGSGGIGGDSSSSR